MMSETVASVSAYAERRTAQLPWWQLLANSLGSAVGLAPPKPSRLSTADLQRLSTAPTCKGIELITPTSRAERRRAQRRALHRENANATTHNLLKQAQRITPPHTTESKATHPDPTLTVASTLAITEARRN